MVDGAPQEARWLRAEPRRTLPAQLLERIAQTAFPRCHVINALPLADGWRNANFKLGLDCIRESIVLRIYEHDASLCQKEVDLIRLIGRSVPIPEVIHAETRGWEDIPPFTLMRYVEGISFRELKRSGDTEAIAQAGILGGRNSGLHRTHDLLEVGMASCRTERRRAAVGRYESDSPLCRFVSRINAPATAHAGGLAGSHTCFSLVMGAAVS
jgi:aminoglycoside phosphotransferase (APT) family kinase protein